MEPFNRLKETPRCGKLQSLLLYIGVLLLVTAVFASVFIIKSEDVKEKSRWAVAEICSQLQGLFGWSLDDRDRPTRSMRNDDTNPDEPNPKILVRVPRKTVWALLGLTPDQARYASRNLTYLGISKDNDTAHSFLSQKFAEHFQARRRRGAFGALGRPGPRPRGLKHRVLVGGRWYGQIRTTEAPKGNATRPPPRVIDRLAHLRKPLTPKKLRQHRRKYVTNKRYKLYVARKKKAKKNRRLIAKMKKKHRQRKKGKVKRIKHVAHSKLTRFLKRYKFQRKRSRVRGNSGKGKKRKPSRKSHEANYRKKTKTIFRKPGRKFRPRYIKRTHKSKPRTRKKMNSQSRRVLKRKSKLQSPRSRKISILQNKKKTRKG